MPPATCCGAEESGNEPPQAPVPPPPDTVADVQETVTAETGTVEQLLKEDPLACRLRVQVFPLEPPLKGQLIVAGLLPLTLPRLGFVAEKLIVPGLAVMPPRVANIVGWLMATDWGWPGLTLPTRTRPPPAASITASRNARVIGRIVTTR